MRKFLIKIQQGGEDKKKLTVIVGSAVIMVAVIYVWLSYFNSLILSSDNPSLSPIQSSENVKSEAKSGFSIWRTMKGGLAAIYDSFAEVIGGAGNIFNMKKEYIVIPSK